MRKLIREPLLHFLLIGLSLFLLYNAVSGGRGGADRRIVVSDATVAAIVQRHQSTWQRPPTPSELKGLIDTHVREEMLYREGVAMGLDRDDSVIRRRVLQKLGVISEESAGQSAPGDADLDAYLKAHAPRYALPAVLSFDQVLFDPVKRGNRLEADLAAARARLNAGADAGALGEPSLLPASIVATAADRLARDFGDDFAQAVLALPIGGWQGPVPSGYGVHLVRVTAKTAGRATTLVEVRAAVERDWENDRRQQANADFERRLRKSYDVVIEAKLPIDTVAQGQQ